MMNRRQHSAEKARSTASTEVVSSSRHYMKKCLALDLDETLVHSSFQPVECSFTINVCIDGVSHNIYVLKRPGVDQFLQRLSEHYELIIYTASLSKYADPLLDLLDPKRLLSRRLFRENCVFYDGHYVKDLSLLSRDISQTIIVDNCPNSYIFHPENAIDCSSFFDDPSDVELWQVGIVCCVCFSCYCLLCFSIPPSASLHASNRSFLTVRCHRLDCGLFGKHTRLRRRPSILPILERMVQAQSVQRSR